MEQQEHTHRYRRCSITRRGDRRDLDHLMKQWIWINTVKQLISAAAGIRVVIHHLIHPLNRQQFRPTAGMSCWPQAGRPVPLRRSGGLNSSPSLEGGNCCWALISVLTLAGVSSHSASGISAKTALITGGSLPEMRPEIKLPSRVSRADIRRELSRPP